MGFSSINDILSIKYRFLKKMELRTFIRVNFSTMHKVFTSISDILSKEYPYFLVFCNLFLHSGQKKVKQGLRLTCFGNSSIFMTTMRVKYFQEFAMIVCDFSNYLAQMCHQFLQFLEEGENFVRLTGSYSIYLCIVLQHDH